MKRATLGDKLNIINQLEAGKIQEEVAENIKLSQSAVSQILKKKDVFLKASQTHDLNSFRIDNNERMKAIDKEVDKFVDAATRFHVPISSIQIRAKARKIAQQLGFHNFKASRGWFQKYKQRKNLSRMKICGESASVDPLAIVEWKFHIKDTILQYSPQNIYNADKTGLFYRQLLRHTYVRKADQVQKDKLKASNSVKGVKEQKVRVTVMFCVSMTGEKMTPVVIGKHAKPRCFKAVNYDFSRLPVEYYATGNAWMVSDVFQEWLQKWNDRLLSEGRKVLLFVDNFSGHKLRTIFSQIRIEFLPPNCTSCIQPLDAGIIKAFKDYYLQEITDKMLNDVEKTEVIQNSEKYNVENLVKDVSLMHVVNFIAVAFDKVSPSVVRNCWKHCDFYVDECNSKVVALLDHDYTKH